MLVVLILHYIVELHLSTHLSTLDIFVRAVRIPNIDIFLGVIRGGVISNLSFANDLQSISYFLLETAQLSHADVFQPFPEPPPTVPSATRSNVRELQNIATTYHKRKCRTKKDWWMPYLICRRSSLLTSLSFLSSSSMACA